MTLYEDLNVHHCVKIKATISKFQNREGLLIRRHVRRRRNSAIKSDFIKEFAQKERCREDLACCKRIKVQNHSCLIQIYFQNLVWSRMRCWKNSKYFFKNLIWSQMRCWKNFKSIFQIVSFPQLATGLLQQQERFVNSLNSKISLFFSQVVHQLEQTVFPGANHKVGYFIPGNPKSGKEHC